MTFVHLSFLAGTALVALPIVLHLIMRQRPTLFEFPALRFLQKRHDANRRRLQLRHLLLLLLRAAAIAILAFALARPSVKLAGALGSQRRPSRRPCCSTPPRTWNIATITRPAWRPLGRWVLGCWHNCPSRAKWPYWTRGWASLRRSRPIAGRPANGSHAWKRCPTPSRSRSRWTAPQNSCGKAVWNGRNCTSLPTSPAAHGPPSRPISFSSDSAK